MAATELSPRGVVLGFTHGNGCASAHMPAGSKETSSSSASSLSLPRQLSGEEFKAHAMPITFDAEGVADHDKKDRYRSTFFEALSDYSTLIHLATLGSPAEIHAAFTSLSEWTQNALLRGVSEEDSISFDDAFTKLLNEPKNALHPHIVASLVSTMEEKINLQGIELELDVSSRYVVAPPEPNLGHVAEISTIMATLQRMEYALSDIDEHGTFKGVNFESLAENFQTLPQYLQDYIKGHIYKSSSACGQDVGLDFGDMVLGQSELTVLNLIKTSSGTSLLSQIYAYYNDNFSLDATTSTSARILHVVSGVMDTSRTLSLSAGDPLHEVEHVVSETTARAHVVALMHELKAETALEGGYVHRDHASRILSEIQAYSELTNDHYILTFLEKAFNPHGEGADFGDITLLNRFFTLDSTDPVTGAPTARRVVDMLAEYAEASAILSSMELAIVERNPDSLSAIVRDCSCSIIGQAVKVMQEKLDGASEEEVEGMRKGILELRRSTADLMITAIRMISERAAKEDDDAAARVGMDGGVPDLARVAKDMGVPDDIQGPGGRKLRVLITTVESALYSVGGLGPAVHGAAKALPKDRYDAVIFAPYHEKINPQIYAKVEKMKAGAADPDIKVETLRHQFAGSEVDSVDTLYEVKFKGATYLLHETSTGKDGRGLYEVREGETFYGAGGPEFERLRMAYLSNAIEAYVQKKKAEESPFDNMIINDSHTAGAFLKMRQWHFDDHRIGETPAVSFIVHNNGFHTKFPGGMPGSGHGQENMHYYAVEHSDTVATVSATHAKELCTPEDGNGIEGSYQYRAHKEAFFGILNGIDTGGHDPAQNKKFRGKALLLDGSIDEMDPSFDAGLHALKGVHTSMSSSTKEERDTAISALESILSGDTSRYYASFSGDDEGKLSALISSLRSFGDGTTDISAIGDALDEAAAILNTFIISNSLAFTETDERIVQKKTACKHVLQGIYREHYEYKTGMPGANAQINFFDSDGSERPLMYYVGRLDAKQKGLQHFREALEAAKEKGAVLVVMGAPEEGVHEERSAREILDEVQTLADSEADATTWGGAWIVREVNKQPGEEKSKYPYQVGSGSRPGIGDWVRGGADFLYSPSNYEPCGLTPPEALIKGAALAMTRVGGFVEWNEKAGNEYDGKMLLDRGHEHKSDISALLEEWYKVSSDTDRRTEICQKMVRAGKASDWKVAIEKYEMMMAIARRRKWQRDARFYFPNIGVDALVERMSTTTAKDESAAAQA